MPAFYLYSSTTPKAVLDTCWELIEMEAAKEMDNCRPIRHSQKSLDMRDDVWRLKDQTARRAWPDKETCAFSWFIQKVKHRSILAKIC